MIEPEQNVRSAEELIAAKKAVNLDSQQIMSRRRTKIDIGEVIRSKALSSAYREAIEVAIAFARSMGRAEMADYALMINNAVSLTERQIGLELRDPRSTLNDFLREEALHRTPGRPQDGLREQRGSQGYEE